MDLDWDKKLVMHLDLLMVLWTEIKMACWMSEHSGSYLVHLVDTDEGIILSSTDGEVHGSTLGALDSFTLGLNEGTELGSSDGSSDGSNEGTVLGASEAVLEVTSDGILEGSNCEFVSVSRVFSSKICFSLATS